MTGSEGDRGGVAVLVLAGISYDGRTDFYVIRRRVLTGVDNFILFNIFSGKNKISKLLISVEIRCKWGKVVLN